ncbi:MAG: hypothetical protein A4E71_01094 [Smithella sp. PtaU1.Bin162]|nr:MAG: hypothetical protein A4E71_01094 [Smithella sp. PtaU1.Bin162]
MEKNIIFLFFAVLTILFLSAVNCWALRCGSGLVGSGDSKAKVLITCGSPTFKETSCAESQKYTAANKSGKVKKVKKCGKKVEEWYYNCGEGDFIYKLTFENGVLKSENTEGRGSGKSDCREN